MNNANKPQVYWTCWSRLSPNFFLDAKGKTHGLPDSSRVRANKNRTVPLMSITSLGYDFHFLLPGLNVEPLSAALFFLS